MTSARADRVRSPDHEVKEESIVATFADRERALAATHALDKAGIPPDHVGVVAENVRQAREAAGSFSAQGAIVGALLGLFVAAAVVVLGGETIQRSIVAVALGAPALVLAFGAIGALAGRAKLWQSRHYERYERVVGMGDSLVTVSGEPAELARARGILQRSGATAIRREDTAEAI
jgi:hypothetical protein